MADLFSGTAAQSTPSVFNFGAHAVRIIVRDGEPWFVASDVAEALGYRDAANAGRILADHQKADTQIVSTSSKGAEQARRVTIINESGLYRLVLRSRKPEAEKFSDWVTGEVLPSIRKTGRYEKLGREKTVNEIVADWVEKIEQPNGYPAFLFQPLVEAVQRKLGKRAPELPSGKMLVDRKKLAAIWVDLEKLRSRIDAMGCVESDFPPSWWVEKAISA